MPPLRVLARILLVILFLVDGMLGAAVATEIATHHAASDGAAIGHTAHGAGAEPPPPDCHHGVKASTPGGERDAFLECGCFEEIGCSCNYLLALDPGRAVLLFWLQGSYSTHPATASPSPRQQPMSPVFRPPIG